MPENLEGYKIVYNAERKDVRPLYVPADAETYNYRPFTSVEPPQDKNLTVTDFDWNTNSWTTIEVATPEQLLDTQVAIAELYELMLGGMD